MKIHFTRYNSSSISIPIKETVEIPTLTFIPRTTTNYNMINQIQYGGKCLACNK